MTSFLEKLGIESPIVQAPMAGVDSPAMAAAVANAGALGSLGVGAVDAETTRRLITEVRSLTDRPININVFCHRPAVVDAARDSAWLDRLRPEFARYGAQPPPRLTEIYRTFLTHDAKLAAFHRSIVAANASRSSATSLGEINRQRYSVTFLGISRTYKKYVILRLRRSTICGGLSSRPVRRWVAPRTTHVKEYEGATLVGSCSACGHAPPALQLRYPHSRGVWNLRVAERISIAA